MDTMVSSAPLPRDAARADPSGDTIARRLARFAAGLRLADVPAAVIEQAKLHILDGIGIGLASCSFDFAQRTLRALHNLGGTGRHAVIGSAIRLPLRDAIHANGTLVHGLDFDDTHGPAVVHVTAAALPTALCAAVEHGASGAGMLEAYLVSLETAARIGAAARGGFHLVGFHPTGMVNVFGAALAAGRLAGLDETQLTHAQGIALSMAAGSLEFLQDGAWTKRQHPGWAGVAGVTAAALAREGFEGPALPYEGRYGLYAMYMRPDAARDLELATADLGEAWEMRRVALKPYPCCHFNHAFADATLALMRAHGLRAEQVRRVRALIGAGQVGVVCEPEAAKRRPANAYEAQFSVHYTIAATLVRGRFTLAELEPEATGDPRIQELCQRIAYEIDPDSAYPRFYSGEVIVDTTDGRALRHREAVNRGADERPLAVDEILAKFRANAERTITPTHASRIVDMVLSLDRLERAVALADILSIRQ